MKRHKALDMSGLFNHKLIYKELPKSGEYTADTSDGISLYCAITSGFIQTRIL